MQDDSIDREYFFNLRWEHPEKLRYYQLVCSQDLFGDYVLTKAWGGINQQSGRITYRFCESFQLAVGIMQKIAKLRIQRGYLLKIQHLPMQLAG